MDIIVFNGTRGRTRRFSLTWVGLSALAAIGFFALAGNGLLAYRYFTDDLSANHLIASWRDRLEIQKREVSVLNDRAEADMSAVGRRLAAMEARLLRMEALGERVSEIANLDNGEFRFDEPAPMGGPQHPTVGVPANYLADIGRLAGELRKRERELEVLDSLLASRKFHEDLAPSGRPVTWGWISSPYGERVDPISGRPSWHDGVDFAGRPGSDIVAVASGVAIHVGERSGYGKMVEIDHGDGYTTRYAHALETLVATGDVIKKGDVIARMGSTGRSTGPHVHFEVVRHGKHIDPAKFIARR